MRIRTTSSDFAFPIISKRKVRKDCAKSRKEKKGLCVPLRIRFAPFVVKSIVTLIRGEP